MSIQEGTLVNPLHLPLPRIQIRWEALKGVINLGVFNCHYEHVIALTENSILNYHADVPGQWHESRGTHREDRGSYPHAVHEAHPCRALDTPDTFFPHIPANLQEQLQKERKDFPHLPVFVLGPYYRAWKVEP